MADSTIKLPATPPKCRPGILRLMLLGSVLYTLIMLLWVASSVHDISSASESLPLSIVRLFTNGQHTPTPEELEAQAHALTVKTLPDGATVERQFKCIGWRATTDCSADGARDLANDKPCNRRVGDGASGYCEIEDVESGERFRVMQRGCSTVKKGAKFSCSNAPDFVNFHAKGRKVVEKAIAPGYHLPNVMESEKPKAGIVMVVYPTLLASAYASVRMLREVLNCRLPIEIWYRSDELMRVPGALEPLKGLAKKEAERGITFREITDRRAFRFAAKVYAVYNSAFDQVLFLDADNVPVRDPTFLFESEEFVRTGSVFWPDFWHPQYTIFHIMADSLLWQLLDMKYVNMFEQESGQLLIDRRRHTATMELVNFFTFYTPNHFDQLKLVYGDKDLFRYAWIKLNVPFYMVQTPPAVAGKVVNESFCGMTMVQHDANGEVLFLHRNSNKLTGRVKREEINYEVEARRQARLKLLDQGLPATINDEQVQAKLKILKRTPPPTLEPPEPDNLPDPAIWTHLWTFRNTSRRVDYRIRSYTAQPDFPEWQRCYGQRNISDSEHFFAQKIADLSFAGLETHLRHFAMEGAQLLENRQPTSLERV
ncbi:putative Mannosyltransferase [Phytophthora infestans]|uniref:Putative Mannosyltransferase n=1 Tax=Phytophthora infestans TaxID=4787 RepID=A0A833SFH8_PHYIN|nr:putative Mannosyltransferase [Phytophthora infestans]